MSGLVTFYKSRIDDLNDKEGIKAILNGEKVSEATIFSLIEECQALSVEGPQDSILFYQKLLTIILLIPYMKGSNPTFDLHVEELLKRGKREGYWSTLQLPTALCALSTFLSTGVYERLETQQLEKGGVLLDSGSHIFDGNVIKPFETTLIALIWLYLGWANHDEETLNAGLKTAEFCINLCDKEGVPFQGLWTRESEYNSLRLHSSLALLFSIASHIRLSSKMNVMKEMLYEKLEKETLDDSEPLTFLLAMKFRELIETGTSYPEVERTVTVHDIDQSLGFLRYEYEDLSMACSVCGVSTGLGAIHKNGMHIVSFGPHFYPLADSESFGIYRTSNGSREGFKDLTMERSEDSCQFRGWSRLIMPGSPHVSKQNFSFAHPGDQWLFFDIKAEKENLEVGIRLDKCIDETPLTFTFFISADEACIEGQNKLLPGSLERFQGENAPINLIKDGKITTIQPSFEGEMQVIPLAGKKHFWSADFLLAFPLTEKLKLYSWHIN